MRTQVFEAWYFACANKLPPFETNVRVLAILPILLWITDVCQDKA